MSDWIEWTGGENPVPGQMVEVDYLDGNGETHMLSDEFRWDYTGNDDDIIAYRLASPPAGQPAKETCFGLSGIALMGGLEDQPADHIGEVDLAELKRLAEAATPGPWLYDRDGDEGSVWTRQPHTGELARTAPEDINGDFPAYANAAFIAAANPATVLSLLSLIARQQETIRGHEEALTEAKAVVEPFAAMGTVLEARSRITFGKHIKDDEIVLESVGEAGFGILTMGHFRDALHIASKPRGWSGLYRTPIAARARLSARQGGG